jgi:hypothetical protein
MLNESKGVACRTKGVGCRVQHQANQEVKRLRVIGGR